MDIFTSTNCFQCWNTNWIKTKIETQSKRYRAFEFGIGYTNFPNTTILFAILHGQLPSVFV
jgi:hypothetical protein